ncbi:MAG: tRNA uridine-5-carboxymethylaminomethyl(34) synthesis GTPase MnmE [Candidatus Omnitrophica bacterium]|nr:tRNA uridine-5-carboxymethylaminomethyl(34) synthesis GTPase MnmE [Candidatus Omnitrophota bacterium]MDE2232047.1 tRNA uridine-5-carboxymethylaminomethyl(34) synthesis GTPase MnmE [Candidatus Omnitrophota bacterium]
MYQYKGMEDTIAAIATPAGQGAIGIIRISGRDAIAVADRVLRLDGNKTLQQCPTHTVHHGWAVKSQDILDEVLVTVMRAPKSYTAENVVEICCHGGLTVLRTALQEVLNAGARLAAPGEFTKRAFLNGRMDLAQAEAVIDVINARTRASLRQSHYQLKGELSSRLKSIREELMKLYTMVEAMINFPEDAVEAESRQQISGRLKDREDELIALLRGAQTGRLLKEGMRIVLCGKPNVGKSSLLNALLKEQRAIVTDIAGTTRDVLEESAQINGIPVALVDTAGILKAANPIEEEAVKRSRLYIKSADLVLLVLDHSRPLEEEDLALMEQLKAAPALLVVNKTDLAAQMDMGVVQRMSGGHPMIKTSALDAESVRGLEAGIAEFIAKDKDLESQEPLISNIRHIQSLQEAQKNLQAACRLAAEGTSLEFISEEIKSAVNHLDAITGRNIDEDLLESIFSEFCIGK